MLIHLALALLAVFAPAAPVLGAALALVICDLLTGIVAARQKGESITSRGMRRSVTKLCVYEVALAISYLAGTYLLVELPALKIVASMIGLTELRSIFENLAVISDEPMIRALVGKLGGPPEVK